VIVPRSLRWELIVVTNNCTDRSEEILRSFAGQLPLRTVNEPHQGVAHARNRVLREARGEIIAWTDDDVLVDSAWMSQLVDAARRHPQAAAFGGLIEPWFATRPDPLLLEAFPVLARGFCGLDLGPVERPLGPGEEVFGANMAYRASMVSGLAFDPALGPNGHRSVLGEETALHRQLRQRGPLVWVPSMRVKHHVPAERMRLSYLLAYAFDNGRTEVRIEGVPPGTRLMGVPRWLIRMCVSTYVEYRWNQLRQRPAAALKHLREHHRCRGYLLECRARAGRQASTGNTPEEMRRTLFSR
jgi:glycosyltransferase involved in cell wall biosynthesis